VNLEFFEEVAAKRRRARVRLAALAAVGGLTLALALLAPRPGPEPPPPPPTYAFLREPSIRVKIGSIPSGGKVRIAGALVESDPVARDREARYQGGVLRLDDVATPLPATLGPEGDRTIGFGDGRYRGDIVLAKDPTSDALLVVNRLPLERYLEGVVLSEMSPKFPEEALRAQTVASRSYAAHKILAMRGRPFDVTDTQRSQVYRGERDRGRALAARLVRSTRGVALFFDGAVLETVFSSTCGGTTRSAREAFGSPAPAPLCGVPCGRCDGGEFSTWSCRTSRAAFARAASLGGPPTAIVDLKRSESDRLESAGFRVGATTKTLSGPAIRSALGDKALSTWITRLEIDRDAIVAEGRGYGHGAGMCQVGARSLANAGENWLSILLLYFPGATAAPLFPDET
jgi:stage II sporulation protein D